MAINRLGQGEVQVETLAVSQDRHLSNSRPLIVRQKALVSISFLLLVVRHLLLLVRHLFLLANIVIWKMFSSSVVYICQCANVVESAKAFS